MVERSDSDTIMGAGEFDFLEELSDYLDVLSNSARLKILKLIESKPKDARTISHEIETSYENTKKHLDKLLSIGLIRKEAGIGKPTSKGVHPVWEYSLVPGALDAITRNLAIFSNTPVTSGMNVLSAKIADVRQKLSHEFGANPAVIVMGGVDDGKVFFIRQDSTDLGRYDRSYPSNKSLWAIILSEDYKAVTRITRPHGRITEHTGELFLEDCGSTGGTYINNKRIGENEKVPLTDGMLIDLSKGPNSARLLVVLPPKKSFDTINTVDREKLEEKIRIDAKSIAKKLDFEHLVTDEQGERRG